MPDYPIIRCDKYQPSYGMRGTGTRRGAENVPYCHHGHHFDFRLGMVKGEAWKTSDDEIAYYAECIVHGYVLQIHDLRKGAFSLRALSIWLRRAATKQLKEAMRERFTHVVISRYHDKDGAFMGLRYARSLEEAESIELEVDIEEHTTIEKLD